MAGYEDRMSETIEDFQKFTDYQLGQFFQEKVYNASFFSCQNVLSLRYCEDDFHEDR